MADASICSMASSRAANAASSSTGSDPSTSISSSMLTQLRQPANSGWFLTGTARGSFITPDGDDVDGLVGAEPISFLEGLLREDHHRAQPLQNL